MSPFPTPETDPQVTPPAVAIIGMAGRFPGAPDLEAFWQNLVAGVDSLTRFSAAEAETAPLDPTATKDFVGARGLLADPEFFDADFFSIPPREAEHMDPQHRVFLEICHQALEDAGYGSPQDRPETGLFAGASLNTYLLHHLAQDRAFVEDFAASYQVGELTRLFGNDKDFLTTRVAYKLDLRGPVMTVQAACATSLVAVAQAAQSLLHFGCDMALAGGVSITFPQLRGHRYSEGSLASRDGYIRPFDAEASGTVFGHGAGAVVLKRLEDALRDGDPIRAVLRGFAVTNDGAAKAGYMAPAVEGQARAIAAAQLMAGVLPEDISYIEAHGTGTPLGDPIELAALNRAFAENGCARTGFCQIGTAKANMGHLDAAAGIAGLLKTVLQLHHRFLPGLAHFTAPNPRLELQGSPFFFSAEPRPWESETPRLAGVSAFGVGGVNAHLIVEEAPSRPPAASPSTDLPLCLSARSPEALATSARELAECLAQHPECNLAEAAWTMAAGRSTHRFRVAVAASTPAATIQALRSLAPTVEPSRPRRLALLFPGQGSQFAGMGRDLYDREPLFRTTIDRAAELARHELGLDLRSLLFPAPEAAETAQTQLAETRFAQPALFSISYAVATLLAHWGLEPETTAGHSLGEFVSATLAGVMRFEDALHLLCLRGRLMQTCEPGAMLSVPLGETALTPFLLPGITISALNSSRASVLAGSFAAVDALEARLAADGIAARRLRTSHAFHSPSMQPMVEPFTKALRAIALSDPRAPWVSTVTGRWITPAEATDPAYWAAQCTLPVRFAEAFTTLRAAGLDLLLEAGPGEALSALARHDGASIQPTAAVTALPTLGAPCRQDAPGRCRTPGILLAELFAAGLTPDWHAIFPEGSRRRIPLPTYSFQRKRFWVDPPPSTATPPSSPLQAAQPTLAPEPTTMPVAPTEAARLPRLAAEVAEVFSALSGIDISPAEHEVSFLELGLDSLFLTQATLALQKRFGIKVTFRQLTEQFPAVGSLAQHLDRALPPDAAPAPAALVSLAPQPVASPLPSLGTTVTAPEGSVQSLFAQQVAALASLFQQQIAALGSAAAMPSAPAAAATPPPAAPAIPSTEQRHGSFRPPVTKSSDSFSATQISFLSTLIAAYNAKTPGSKQRTSEARAYLADPRAVAGFRPQFKEMVYPLVTDRALGARLWDVDGNEYIDIVNGYGCILFGHSPDFVVEAVKAQLDRGVAIGPQSVLAGEVAQLIAELTGNERVTFCNTGSEAVMAAIRVARTVTGRDKFVYFAGDYHGTFDEVLMRQTPRGSAPIAPGIPPENTTNVVVLEYGTPASMAWIREHAQELAAVLIEPVQTRHPDLQPLQFIRDLRTLTAEQGICFILDEVVTGFRLAPGGVQSMLGIRADMCTYGKVIGGGHPIGVLSGKRAYLDALDGGAWQFGDSSAPEVGVTFFAGTFVRHPLALAAAKSVLLHLKDQGPALQDELNRKTHDLAQRLDAFFDEQGVPARIHSFASWFYWTFPSEHKLASLFYYAMRLRGIHIQEGYPCFLTTAHTDADLQAIEQAFRETILEMQAAGALPSSAAPDDDPKPTSRATGPRLHPESRTQTPSRIPMTEPQREIFFAAALSDDANCAFNESLTVRLSGPVRLDDLRFALDAVLARHDALRSTVCMDGEALCIDPAFAGVFDLADLRDLPRAEQEQRLADRRAEEARTPFPLTEGPLFRLAGFLRSDREVVLLLTAHHIILDGWSANQLLEEVGAVYSGGAVALNELSPLLPFSSYALREHEREQRGEFDANQRFWVSLFEGRSPRLELPTDRPRPPRKTYTGATLEGELRPDLLPALKKLSARNGASLFVTLLSAFQLLLHRLTGQDEVVVGISTAGQSLLEDASLVGHCVHFLPMLSSLAEGETAEVHLRRTRTLLLDAQEHSEFTFGSLLRKLTLERDPSRLPLIEVQFNLEKIGANVRFEGLTTELRANPKAAVNTDLFLNMVETPTGLAYALDYNTDLFDASTVRRWMGHLEHLLEAELADLTQPVHRLPLLTSAEREQILHGLNRTAVDFGPFVPFHETVLQIATAEPQRLAVESAELHWTYAELGEYATLLARRLVHEGLKPGDLVGICIERSLEMAGAMLAVAMAGGAWVPLDPRHPRERLHTILADAGITLLLTGRDPVIDTGARLLNITGPQPRYDTVLLPTVAANSLAYVIYTSGSTGKPKGVAVEHRALRNLLLSMQREPGFSRNDTLVAITTLAFDIAALEVLLPLITGARLVLATDEQVTDGTHLLALIQDSEATVLQATPGAWRILLDAGWSASHPLKALCGGEALPPDLADALLTRASELWNVYGPTETTIWSSATRVTAGAGPLRIGPPIANTQFYVLDETLSPAPIGIVGELMIGGDGLARGYWKRPELTQQTFLAHPFLPNGRIYRTGDLARLHADGTIELLGRADFQVKIRGYRIELGEIEVALTRHWAVREAVVLSQPGLSGVPHLLGFADVGNAETEATLLRDHLGQLLPTYMVPPVLLTMPTLPRLPNGKVDRSALLRRAAESETSAPAPRTLTAPATDAEHHLARLWSETLNLPSVSVTDSIFELGGDSLAIFRIAARATREGLRLQPAAIFEHRTIRAIVMHLPSGQTSTHQATAPDAKTQAPRIGAAPRQSYRITR